MTQEELEQARVQLHVLACKLGVVVGGCGCCGLGQPPKEFSS
jgi:hypothetical protein